MKIKLNENYLITTDAWFYAPDGGNYRAVWGKVTAIENSENTLGIKTNAKSTNWYVTIGDMVVAGCQIHYAIRADKVNFKDAPHYEINGEVCHLLTRPTNIYNANQSI